MIKLLKWDSDFFGFNIAHLELVDKFPDLQVIDNFISKNGIDFVQAHCDIANIKTINCLENNGFNYADLKINHILDINKIDIYENPYQLADKNDVSQLKKIASSAFADSRYYHDRFDKKKVNLLFETWVEKAVLGTLDNVCLKIVEGHRVAGFVTLKNINKKAARIGLIGIDKDLQKKGVGSRLLDSLFYYAAINKIENIEVSTQGKNVSAQNFYIKKGFRLKDITTWYYKFLN